MDFGTNSFPSRRSYRSSPSFAFSDSQAVLKKSTPLFQQLKQLVLGRSEQDQAKIVLGITLLFWIVLSVVFTYVYNYEPMPVFRIPEDLNTADSVCSYNQTCLFVMGGAFSIIDTFLPAVEAFNGTEWGSEAMLPPNQDGTYGQGVSTSAAVLGGKIYVIGHKGFGYMFSYSGYKVGGRWWIPEARMGHPREGFALAIFRGRIYAIGGKTLCQPQSYEENPQSKCLPGEEKWLLTGPQSALETSVVVESIDPRTEKQWRTECYISKLGTIGNSSRCLQTPRSGASATEFRDRLYVIGGYYGGSVEVFDGDSWQALEHSFPFGHFGASALAFNDKLWVFGGFAYAQYLDTSIVFDGKVWVAVTQLLVPRAWGAACVLDLPDEQCASLRGWLPGQPCQRVYLLGGVDAESALASAESFDGQTWRREPPLLNKRGRLAAVAFAKQVQPKS